MLPQGTLLISTCAQLVLCNLPAPGYLFGLGHQQLHYHVFDICCVLC